MSAAPEPEARADASWSLDARRDEDGRVYLDAAQLVGVLREKADRFRAAARSHGDPIPAEQHGEAIAQHCLAVMIEQFADDIDCGCLDYLRETV